MSRAVSLISTGAAAAATDPSQLDTPRPAPPAVQSPRPSAAAASASTSAHLLVAPPTTRVTPLEIDTSGAMVGANGLPCPHSLEEAKTAAETPATAPASASARTVPTAVSDSDDDVDSDREYSAKWS